MSRKLMRKHEVTLVLLLPDDTEELPTRFEVARDLSSLLWPLLKEGVRTGMAVSSFQGSRDQGSK
jgi:hypothetical protein